VGQAACRRPCPDPLPTIAPATDSKVSVSASSATSRPPLQAALSQQMISFHCPAPWFSSPRSGRSYWFVQIRLP